MDEKEPDSSHESDPTAAAGSSSTLIPQSEMTMGIEELSVGDRSVVLRDFVVECSLEDAAYLSDELTLTIFGISEEQDTGRMEKVSPTTWIYYRVIELKSSMDELVFIARSENAGDLGYMVFPQDMLAGLMTIDCNKRLKGELETEETTGSPFLTMVCDVGFTDEWSTTITRARAKINELTIGTEPYFNVLNMLSLALRYRFEKEGQQSDIDEAISLRRAALDRPPPHPDLYLSIDSLAAVLWIRFQHNRQLLDLDESILLNKWALDLEIPPDFESGRDRAVSLDNLAASLQVRFEATGRQIDLDEAISFYRQSLEFRVPPHPNRPTSFDYLGTALLTRFEQTGLASDLDEAISIYRQGLDHESLSHPLRPQYLNNLAVALHHRFKRDGLQSDLDEVILFHREALEHRPPHDADRPSSLINLGSALLTRFRQGGRVSDVDEGISSLRQALELLPPHSSGRSLCLDNLSITLVTRFENTGQQNDLDEAILLHRQGLDLRPTPHPLRSSSLSNLANTLRLRFDQRGQKDDLNESISLLREALELRIPPHPLRSSSLNNLGAALQRRFEVEGGRSDLDEAISSLQEAIKLKSGLHLLRSTSLNNLGQQLFLRFELSGQESDLKESISLHRQALAIQPASHPKRSLSLFSLAKALIRAYLLLWTDEDYLQEAFSSFSAAINCPSQPASFRLSIAKGWIYYAKKVRHASELEAYRAALDTLPQLSALNIGIDLREDALRGESDGLAQDAATCAIRSGNINQAIELLEAGRTIFWSQILSLRSSFEELRDIKPELADKLRNIATALEYGAHRDTSAEMLDNQRKLTIDQETSKLNQLQEDWLTGLDEARRLPGFEDFLRPRRLSFLQGAASQSPVIILLGNDDTSHCLILTSTIVHHIPLSRISGRTLRNLVDLVQSAVSMLPTRLFSETTKVEMEKLLEERAIRRVKDDQLGSSDAIFQIVLRVLWNDIVEPVIKFLQIEKSGTPCVLQWCPTGLFSFLPIHAAGCYDEPSTECASDYFISTYTPTIGALLNQNSTSTASVDGFKMMAVIQSQQLPCTKEELEKIKQHVPSSSLITFGLAGVPADVEAVASRLPDVSIVHFSCHGRQDRVKPLSSGLELEDGVLRVSRIMKEKVLNGSLAFLCACETTMGDQELPDEAMSIGASLLFSGFRRVVGTMWVMADMDGPAITDTFYEELFRGSDGKPCLQPDTTKSAQALHSAVQKLRSKNVPFRRWVPFIHLGK